CSRSWERPGSGSCRRWRSGPLASPWTRKSRPDGRLRWGCCRGAPEGAGGLALGGLAGTLGGLGAAGDGLVGDGLGLVAGPGLGLGGRLPAGLGVHGGLALVGGDDLPA